MDNKSMKQTILFKILCKRCRTSHIPFVLKRNKPLVLVICPIKPIFTTLERKEGSRLKIV